MIPLHTYQDGNNKDKDNMSIIPQKKFHIKLLKTMKPLKGCEQNAKYTSKNPKIHI